MNIFSKFKFLKKRPNTTKLYSKIVRQARQIEFYQTLGVPDTTNGRFDLIALHAFIVMKRLKSLGKGGEILSQSLFDCMFTDIDTNLREMGVGDISVGKKVKSLASAYYGRVKAYEDGLLKADKSIEAAFKRNLYLDTKPSTKQLAAMVHYLREQVAKSEKWSIEIIRDVDFDFNSPPIIDQLNHDD
tara:strand:+ start:423 stop:983 length:561 start_codon:yes stop_codon:yes gene_type:complete